MLSLGERVTLVLPTLAPLVFVVLVGCCIGSLINVLVYRLPRGIGVVTPASRCPACDTRLTWRENIPVLGWLFLRGRCRFCKSPISPEYPIVEAFTGALFGLMYAAWYLAPRHGGLLGIDWQPEWAGNGVAETWPIALVGLTAVGCLVAMTLIDARTFTIPLVLAWVPAIAAVLILPGHAAVVAATMGEPQTWLESPGIWRTATGQTWEAASGWVWSLATPGLNGWWWIGASVGGVIGLAIGAALVRAGLIRRSFADYAAWEATQSATAGPEAWVKYPHARREMVKELAFLGPAAVLFSMGGWAAERLGGVGAAPLWLVVLGGVLLGYLIGGGVVWGVRIFGSFLFGKEAMGIGDVHLMAAVGACFGWIDAVLAFFAAAFVALAWALLGMLAGGPLRRAMPLGPFLAIGTLLVVLGKPVVELGLARLLGAGASGVDLP